MHGFNYSIWVQINETHLSNNGLHCFCLSWKSQTVTWHGSELGGGCGGSWSKTHLLSIKKYSKTKESIDVMNMLPILWGSRYWVRKSFITKIFCQMNIHSSPAQKQQQQAVSPTQWCHLLQMICFSWLPPYRTKAVRSLTNITSVAFTRWR